MSHFLLLLLLLLLLVLLLLLLSQKVTTGKGNYLLGFHGLIQKSIIQLNLALLNFKSL